MTTLAPFVVLLTEDEVERLRWRSESGLSAARVADAEAAAELSAIFASNGWEPEMYVGGRLLASALVRLALHTEERG